MAFKGRVAAGSLDIHTVARSFQAALAPTSQNFTAEAAFGDGGASAVLGVVAMSPHAAANAAIAMSGSARVKSFTFASSGGRTVGGGRATRTSGSLAAPPWRRYRCDLPRNRYPGVTKPSLPAINVLDQASAGFIMLHLHTLGGLELRRSGEGASRVVPLQTKRLMLLAYLAACPGHGLRRRDSIIALFWPELDQDHARGCLRQALHTLRRNVGDDVILTRGQDQVGLVPSALRWDANELQTALAAGDASMALALYEGDFLEGVYASDSSSELDEWIAKERSRLRRVAATAAWAASDQPVVANDRGQHVRRAVQLSGDDEAALRRGLGALDELGDRAGAIALYRDFAHRVAYQLGVEPSVESQAAMRAVQTRLTGVR